MRIRARIIWSVLAICALAAAAGAWIIHKERTVGEREAISEATADANSFAAVAAVAAANHDGDHSLTRALVKAAYDGPGRKLEIIDADRRVIASEKLDAVGGTASVSADKIVPVLRDGQVRTYQESAFAGTGAQRLIVAPVKDASGHVTGAVIEEFSPIHDEFTAITVGTTRRVVSVMLLALLICTGAGLYAGSSLSMPLRELTRAAVGFAAGNRDLQMPVGRNDEIGDLAVAFKVMTGRRREAEEALQRAHDELQERVHESNERAGELALMNARLQREVEERAYAEKNAIESEERARGLAQDLANERERLSELIDSVPGVVFEHWSMDDPALNFVNKYVQDMYGFTPAEWTAEADFWLRRVHPDDQERVKADTVSRRGDGESRHIQFRWIAKDGHIVWTDTYLNHIRDAATGRMGVRGMSLDITEQKRAQKELEETHHKLIDSSRLAGMAEVATSVLHNVGNVLNSVNVSTTIVTEAIRGSSSSHLVRVAALLTQRGENISEYMSGDPVGKKLPAFLDQLSRQLEIERTSVLNELEQLGRYVEHIKDIVAMQQNYATVAGVSQSVPVIDLIEDSIRMNAGALTRHDVQLVREFSAQPVIEVDKHKVMQILVNLIRNAKYACDDSGRNDKLLALRVRQNDGHIIIEVTDNGVGIASENLTRIFSHGFTTRKGGHGFGLHSSALAAMEMGGVLLAHSDGLNRGATFTLELPYTTPKSHAA